MSRTFQDESFLVWEVYPSGNRFGYSEDPFLVFHCLTDPTRRPKALRTRGDEADAERTVRRATGPELIEWLARARDVP